MSPSTSNLKADFARYYWYSSGPRIVRTLGCWCAPGLQATAVYRYGQWARQRTLPVRIVADPVYVVLHLLVKIIWGIEVSRLARIGRGLYIGHFGGITVSSLAVIGKNCNLSQGTTIGVSGSGQSYGAPVIGDNVYIAPGARVFGKITVGNNVKIGANAVIHADVPDEAVVVLAPGFKIHSFNGNPNLNQVE